MRISDWSSDVCSSDLDKRLARVEGEDEAAVAAKADDLAIDIIIVGRPDADIAAERHRKTRHFEHDPLVRDERADAARAGVRQVDGVEQLLRGHGEAARHAASLSPSAARDRKSTRLNSSH